jgi:hypothetical protein
VCSCPRRLHGSERYLPGVVTWNKEPRQPYERTVLGQALSVRRISRSQTSLRESLSRGDGKKGPSNFLQSKDARSSDDVLRKYVRNSFGACPQILHWDSPR